VRDWVKQAEVDAGEGDVLASSEREELAALRVHAVLRREGAVCGRRRVARLMRAAAKTRAGAASSSARVVVRCSPAP
jgi:helix-turn-helix protein